jgi:hypothetical protein
LAVAIVNDYSLSLLPLFVGAFRCLCRRIPAAFEVKEGAMNDEIFELMKVSGTPDEIVAQIEMFATTNGPKGPSHS